MTYSMDLPGPHLEKNEGSMMSEVSEVSKSGIVRTPPLVPDSGGMEALVLADQPGNMCCRLNALL